MMFRVFFFYKIQDTGYILLDMPCKNFSQILRKMYKLREKFPLLPYDLHAVYCDDFLLCSLLSSGILYSRLQRVTIPYAVIIQFVLVKVGMLMLETC